MAKKETKIYEELKRFRDDRASVNDYLRCREQSSSTNYQDTEHVRNVLKSVQRESIQEISAEVEIHRIIHNFRTGAAFSSKINYGPTGHHSLRSSILSRVSNVPSANAAFKYSLEV
jgi:hypothetical protein